MKVTDILRVKGNTLYTVHPDQPLLQAVQTMAEMDIGSLVVMEHGDLVGMLTFREVIATVVANNGSQDSASASAQAHPFGPTPTPRRSEVISRPKEASRRRWPATVGSDSTSTIWPNARG